MKDYSFLLFDFFVELVLGLILSISVGLHMEVADWLLSKFYD